MKRLLIIAVLLAGCTSLGHGGRAEPKVARATPPIAEIGIDGDDNELAVALENALDERGVKVKIIHAPAVMEVRGDRIVSYDEVQTRYVLQVRSTDAGRCVPEGSRQMHFYVTLIDYTEQRRVFLSEGVNGCKDTIVKSFMGWLRTK
jgi:hypothetical protein